MALLAYLAAGCEDRRASVAREPVTLTGREAQRLVEYVLAYDYCRGLSGSPQKGSSSSLGKYITELFGNRRGNGVIKNFGWEVTKQTGGTITMKHTARWMGRLETSTFNVDPRTDTTQPGHDNAKGFVNMVALFDCR